MGLELEHLPDSDAWIYLASTGAGAGAQNMLWRVPGASSFLAGASLPYSRHEMQAFCGYEPAEYVHDNTAISMAVSAFLRACQSCPKGRNPIGIGCTASVATLKPHRGAHRYWVAAINGEGWVHLTGSELAKNSASYRDSDGDFVDSEIEQVLLDSVAKAHYWRGDEVLQPNVLGLPWFLANGRREASPTGAVELLPGAFNPVHAGHLDVSSRDTIFQLSLRTPHKDPVSIVEALKRVAAINAAGHDALVENEASTFLAKARKWPGSTFVIGSDTLVRILDPKYGHPIVPMLQEFNALGTRFKIAQRTGDPDVWDILEGIPAPVHFMFERLKDSQYAGLSSTQIRERR